MAAGRDQEHDIDVGYDRDGTIRALRLVVTQNLGAYPDPTGLGLAVLTTWMAAGAYKIPKVATSFRTVTTNTTPAAAYRGAGRPEAAYSIERIVDVVARRTGLDPAEVRRRNFVPPSAFPYETHNEAVVYDSADFPASLDECLRLVDYDGVRREQAARPRRPDQTAARHRPVVLAGDRRLRPERVARGLRPPRVVGIGAGARPARRVGDRVRRVVAARAGPRDHVRPDRQRRARHRVRQDPGAHRRHRHRAAGHRHDGLARRADQRVGGQAGVGQGARPGEEDRRPPARGERARPRGGRRCVQRQGLARQEGRLERRRLGVVPTAAAAPELQVGSLEERLFHESPNFSYPSGSYACVVEIDRDTGEVTIVKMVLIDDCGTVINPLLAEGQVHGGVAQGIAQALYEAVAYDARQRPADHVEPDGLPRPVGSRPPRVHRRPHHHAEPEQPARSEGDRRVRRRRCAAGGGQRRRRRAVRLRGGTRRHAGHAREGVGADALRRTRRGSEGSER